MSDRSYALSSTRLDSIPEPGLMVLSVGIVSGDSLSGETLWLQRWKTIPVHSCTDRLPQCTDGTTPSRADSRSLDGEQRTTSARYTRLTWNVSQGVARQMPDGATYSVPAGVSMRTRRFGSFECDNVSDIDVTMPMSINFRDSRATLPGHSIALRTSDTIQPLIPQS